MVEETGCGENFPFSGEKLSPVLTVYRATNFEAATARVAEIYAHQGAGHSVGIHASPHRAESLAHGRWQRLLPVARVLLSTNPTALPPEAALTTDCRSRLSMGCGTWGGNSFSDNLTYKNFLNITRIARPISGRAPEEAALFADYFAHVNR
jgi:sulfoacetaldehyde dehydrogenase